MANLMILFLVSFCGLAAAGVVDSRWMPQDAMRWRQSNPVMDNTLEQRMTQDPLTRMTADELMRQKFLLRLLDHVHQRMEDVEMEDSFITNDDSYRGGLDQDMMHVIELCKNGQLLGKQERYNIANPTHVRQMIGLQRLLLRSLNWDTFMQNARFARNHINGVLFVNALMLAVRERDDARHLILPAIYEILPELYLDHEALQIARNIDMNLLATSTQRDTYRPNLLDMLSLRGPWKRKDNVMSQRVGLSRLGQLVTGNRNMIETTNKVIIDAEHLNTEENSMKLLTDDVGLKGFLNYLLNDLCLKEHELNSVRRTDLGDLNMNNRDDITHKMTAHKMEMHDTELKRLSMECKRCIDQRIMTDCRICVRTLNIELPSVCIRCIHNAIDHECDLCQRSLRRGSIDMNENWRNERLNSDGMPSLHATTVDNERLLHINRRKMPMMYEMQRMDNGNIPERFMHIVRMPNIEDVRKANVDIHDMDLMNQHLNDDRTLLDRLHNTCRRCLMELDSWNCKRCLTVSSSDDLRQLSPRCLTCIERQTDMDCKICKEGVNRNGMRDRLGDISMNRGDMSHRMLEQNEVKVSRISLDCRRCIDTRTPTDCRNCIKSMNIEQIRGIPENCLHCIHNRIDRDCRMCRSDLQEYDSRDTARLDMDSRRDLHSTVINNDRLLHVNRKKLNAMNNMNPSSDEQQLLMKHRIVDGRKIKDDDDDVTIKHRQMSRGLDINQLSSTCRTCIDDRKPMDCRTCLMETGIGMLRSLTKECLQCIHHRLLDDCRLCQTMLYHRQAIENKDRAGISDTQDLPFTTLDNDRLLHINRKKLNAMQGIERLDNTMMNGNMRERFLNVLHTHGIDDGRKIKQNDDDINMMVGRINLERNSGYSTIGGHIMNNDMNGKVSLDRMRMNLQRLNTDCMGCIERRSLMDCKDCVMSLDIDMLRTLPRQCLQCMHHRMDNDCNMCRMLVRDDTVRFGVHENGNTLEDDLRSTTINDDRLLHVNRKKLNAMNTVMDQNSRMRFMDIVGRRDIADGRKIIHSDDMTMVERVEVSSRINEVCRSCINDRFVGDCNRCLAVSRIEDLQQLGDNCMMCIRRQTDNDCNMCLRHIERTSTAEHRIPTNSQHLSTDCMNCINQRTVTVCNTCLISTDMRKLQSLHGSCLRCINHRADTDCDMCESIIHERTIVRPEINDERLLHVSRRRWANNMELNSGYSHTHNIVNGRKIKSMEDVKVKERSSHGTDMREQSQGTFGIRQLNDDCMMCIRSRNSMDCNRCLMSTDNDMIKGLHKECLKCINGRLDKDCNKCMIVLHNSKGSIYDRSSSKMQPLRLKEVCISCITERNTYDCNRCSMIMGEGDWSGLHGKCIACIYRQSEMDCDSCQNVMHIEPIAPMDERRSMLQRSNTDERLNGDCISCIHNMIDSDCDRCLRTTSDVIFDRMNDDCLACIHRRTEKDCRLCRIETDDKNLNTRRVSSIVDDDDLIRLNRQHLLMDNSGILRGHNIVDGRRLMPRTEADDLIRGTDILLHNLRQLLIRIDLERLSLGLEPLKTATEQRSMLNERHVQGVLANDVNQMLQNLKLDGRLNDIEVEREIARALMSRDGDVSILSILTDHSSDHTQELQSLGIDLNDLQTLRTFHQLLQTVDNMRTQILGSYKSSDLSLSGVRINDIIVDKLVTRTEGSDIDLKNIFDGHNRVVMLRKRQLTHKDFKIRIDVESERNQRVVVRTFLGPKRTDDKGHEMSFMMRRNDFMLLDTNVVDLIAGRNMIERKSRQLAWAARDTTPLSKIYERVMLGGRGDHISVIGDVTVGQDCRFPHRLILPRGRVDGLDMELLVVITPLENNVISISVDDSILKCSMGMGVRVVDHRSLGFPLDRQIEDSLDLHSFNNIRGIDVKIYHEDSTSMRRW